MVVGSIAFENKKGDKMSPFCYSETLIMQILAFRTEAFTEYPVSPTLVGEYDRNKDRCHNRHDSQGIGTGRCIIDVQAVGRIQRGDHQPWV